MTYEQLKELDREDAIQMVIPDDFDLKKLDSKDRIKVLNQFPTHPDVILFGGHYWETNELTAEFITEYVEPKCEGKVCNFLQEIAKRIATDPVLSSKDLIKNVNIDYSIIFDQYNRMLRRNPDSLFTWAKSRATFIWFEHILPKTRAEQFVKIKKEQDNEKLNEISSRIKKIYSFTDLEMIYLKYFCSQSKLDDLDISLNTVLYFWSKQKMTGKTTIAAYICSFLNGETKRNESPHKSNLGREMQIRQFDIPCAVNSRCTMLDEAAFHDMTKTYEKFKSMVTSNSCEIEYKFQSSHIPRKCYRNYIFTSNDNPVEFVKDESERRILSVHFSIPEQISFEELEKIWYEFVLECNYSAIKLEAIYKEIITPNAQEGDIKYIKMELKDILTKEKINGCTPQTFFSVSNVMLISEILLLKPSREIVKDVLVSLYGEPDKCQRFKKMRREIQNDIEEEDKEITLPF